MKSFKNVALIILGYVFFAALFRTAAAPMLMVVLFLFDVIWSFGLLVHCDGSCCRKFMNYFEDHQSRVKKVLIGFLIFFTVTIPNPICWIAVVAMTAHLGWFNLTTKVAKSYIRQVYGK